MNEQLCELTQATGTRAVRFFGAGAGGFLKCCVSAKSSSSNSEGSAPFGVVLDAAMQGREDDELLTAVEVGTGRIEVDELPVAWGAIDTGSVFGGSGSC